MFRYLWHIGFRWHQAGETGRVAKIAIDLTEVRQVASLSIRKMQKEVQPGSVNLKLLVGSGDFAQLRSAGVSGQALEGFGAVDRA